MAQESQPPIPPAEFALQINHLSADDQAVVKGLKIGEMNMAPADTRQFTYIKGRVKVSNESGLQAIISKLHAQTRLLLKTKDGDWFVLKCNSFEFDLGERGSSEVLVSFRETNKKIEAITGDRLGKIVAAHTVYRFAGKIFFVEPAPTDKTLPEAWWTKEDLIGKAPAPAVPVAEPQLPELRNLRKTYEQKFATQVSAPFDKSVADLRKSYLAAIDRAVKAAQETGNLDEALALREERAKAVEVGYVPEAVSGSGNTPAALANLRNIYLTAFYKIQAERTNLLTGLTAEYHAGIDEIIVKLTRSGQLESAKAVRDYKGHPLDAVAVE